MAVDRPIARQGRVRIGISGWRYRGWRGVFYPKGLPQRRELEFASRRFDSIEINGSFYSLLRPEAVRTWYEQTPDDFVFAVKGSRYITHMKRLTGAEALNNFFASGVLALKEKLGPVLWQLPPTLAFDPERLERFFEGLPRTTTQAGALARRHDERLAGRAYVAPHARRALRYALEVRHPSFWNPEFVALLRRHGVALCIADSAGLFPDFEDVTADFVYVRLHGATELYVSGYTRPALRRWAARIEAWSRGGFVDSGKLAAPKEPPERRAGRDVYVYFDNDAKVHAPFDALALASMLGGEAGARAARG